jgi:hypothetical protein
MAKIDIDDRLYKDLIDWATLNGLSKNDIKNYINKAIRDRLNLDKYGDLNEKIKQNEIKPQVENKEKKDVPSINKEIIIPILELENDVKEEKDDEVKQQKRKRIIQSK